MRLHKTHQLLTNILHEIDNSGYSDSIRLEAVQRLVKSLEVMCGSVTGYMRFISAQDGGGLQRQERQFNIAMLSSTQSNMLPSTKAIITLENTAQPSTSDRHRPLIPKRKPVPIRNLPPSVRLSVSVETLVAKTSPEDEVSVILPLKIKKHNRPHLNIPDHNVDWKRRMRGTDSGEPRADSPVLGVLSPQLRMVRKMSRVNAEVWLVIFLLVMPSFKEQGIAIHIRNHKSRRL